MNRKSSGYWFINVVVFCLVMTWSGFQAANAQETTLAISLEDLQKSQQDGSSISWTIREIPEELRHLVPEQPELVPEQPESEEDSLDSRIVGGTTAARG